MARPSLNPDKARQGGGGVEPGNYEVITSKFMNIKTDYKPNQMYLCFPDAAVLDKDGDKVRGADAVEINFSFGEKSLEFFHPANATGADDNDPTDQGDAVDAEGNTIYCTEDETFTKSCGAMVFLESLAKHGFPKAILDRCWAPDFEGLKVELATMTAAEVNKKFGTRLSERPAKDGNTITYKVAVKWLNPTYLGKAGAGAKAGKSKDAEPVHESENGKPQGVEDITKHVLSLVAVKKAGPKNPIKNINALNGFFAQQYSVAKMDPKHLKACQDKLKDEAWLEDAVIELGGTFEAGVATFPALT